MDHKIRCPWCEGMDIYRKYHDEEWGVPMHSDQKLFEHLTLESLQCGLNWLMMLRKREVFRKCFAGFDYAKVSVFDEAQIQKIMDTPGMIRSRRKIEAVINNAGKYADIVEEWGSFDRFLWRFTDGRTLVYQSHLDGQGCAENELSQTISRELKKRGFQYVGPVTIYSHLQACGLVNDHIPQCWRFEEVNKMADVKIVE